MSTDLYYDIYLWVFPESNKLTKIGHLSRKDAERLANKWFEMNELHDYMLVTEGSTPWYDEPVITVKPREWLENLNEI